VSVFGVFLMRQAIEMVPTDYIEAARIDGGGELGIFWRIVLPSVAATPSPRRSKLLAGNSSDWTPRKHALAQILDGVDRHRIEASLFYEKPL